MGVRGVHSTKYDGSLHYAFPLMSVAQAPGLRVAWQEPGAPMRSYRGDGLTQHHSLHFYWSDLPFNLTVMWRPGWVARSLYVNIATPATWDDDLVRFVDLDLDVSLQHQAQGPVVEDRDEFEERRVAWGYPPDLVARAETSVERVLDLFRRRHRPFCPTLFDWRPDRPLPADCMAVP